MTMEIDSQTESKKNEDDIPQYQILFFKNGVEYDNVYLKQEYVQEQLKLCGLPSKPYYKEYSKCIMVVALITDCAWFDKKFLTYQWALGPYLRFCREIVPLTTPIKTDVSGQSFWCLTNDLWQEILTKNPHVFSYLQLWLQLYKDNLKYIRKWQDIRGKTLLMPWPTMMYHGFKNVENGDHNLNWKVDKAQEISHPSDVRCRQCVTKKKQCPKCVAIQKKVTK